MSTIRIDVEPLAVDATCTDEALRVLLADGREIAVPLAWFPRLQKATPEQRKRWRLIGGGVGLHREDGYLSGSVLKSCIIVAPPIGLANLSQAPRHRGGPAGGPSLACSG